MIKRKRNNIIIGSLLAMVFLMAVGYAVFSTALNISGMGSISSSWNIRITNVEVSNIVGDASDGVGTTWEDLTATINSNLVSPGDSITYDVTVRNDGSIDAVLTDINLTESTNPAISFSTSNLTEGTELGSGEEAILKVTVTYNNSVTSQPEDTSADLSVTLTYEQKGSGTIVPGGDTVNIGGQDVELVTTGDGLYADEYESGRYFYKGADPDNYITFNNETWRIISVENDGTIKIIYTDRASGVGSGGNGWDGTRSNNWDRPSDIKTYLNGNYLATITTNQEKIISHTWSIGGVTPDNNDLVGQINAENELQSQTANVGLITVSEYLRANPNKEQCGSIQLNNTNNNICLSTNWINTIIYSGDGYQYMWTISKSSQNNTGVYDITNSNTDSDSGIINVNNYIDDVDGRTLTYPSVYLTSDITLSGTGTQSDPYIITN